MQSDVLALLDIFLFFFQERAYSAIGIQIKYD